MESPRRAIFCDPRLSVESRSQILTWPELWIIGVLYWKPDARSLSCSTEYSRTEKRAVILIFPPVVTLDFLCQPGQSFVLLPEGRVANCQSVSRHLALHHDALNLVQELRRVAALSRDSVSVRQGR